MTFWEALLLAVAVIVVWSMRWLIVAALVVAIAAVCAVGAYAGACAADVFNGLRKGGR